MKFLVLSAILAVAASAPVASPDEDSKFEQTVGAHTLVHHQQVVNPAVGFAHHFVHPHHNAVFKTGESHVVSGATGAVGFVPGAITYGGAVEVDSDKSHVVFGHHNVAPGVVSHHATYAVAPTVVTHGVAAHGAAAHGVVAHGVAAAPAVATAHHTYSAPAIATHGVAVHGAAAHGVVAHGVASAPAIATHTVATAPAAVSYAHATPVHYAAKVEVSEPVVTVHQQARPSSVTYESEHVVSLGNKEVDVPVQVNTVHIPVEKRIEYGVEKYVAGSTTSIHKPKLSAPAIQAPRVFAPKVHHAAPEVTVTHSEVTVEEKSPNYVHASYDAGVVVEKAAPLLKSHDVPTPVEVPQPVPVAQPYAVAVPTPVKIKSEVNPVVNVDVHHVETQNVVTPVEYTAHHHVASPVVHTAQVVPSAVVAPAVHTHTVVQGAAVPATYHHGHVQKIEGAVFTHTDGASAQTHTGGAAAIHTHNVDGVITSHAHEFGNHAHSHVAVGAAPATLTVHGGAVAAPAAVTTYGVHGGAAAGHAFHTGHAVATGHHVAGVSGLHQTGGHQTVTFGGAVPVGVQHATGVHHTGVVHGVHQSGALHGVHHAGAVHGVQFHASHPVKFETSDNQVVTHHFEQSPTVTYTSGPVHHGVHHVAAPEAVVPGNE